jgi:hypothetical protein
MGLNSACSTHTATASISSSNSSLRQRRLADIAESANEEESPRKDRVGNDSNTSYLLCPSAAQAGEYAASGNDHRLAVVVTSPDSGGVISGLGDGGAVLVVPAYTDAARGRDQTAAASLFLSKGEISSPAISEPRRKSSSSSRLQASDIYSFYPYAPKIKLGPRPHVDTPKRPQTSSDRSKSFQTSSEELRAPIPRSVQIPPRKQPPTSRTKIITAESIPEPQPPPSPLTPTTPSSFHSFSLYSSATSIKTNSDNHSPEKLRLMKALQLRRQQIAEKEQNQQDTIEYPNSPAESTGSVTTEERGPIVSNMPLKPYLLDGIAPESETISLNAHDGYTEPTNDCGGPSNTQSNDHDNSTIQLLERSTPSHRKLEGHEEVRNPCKLDEYGAPALDLMNTISGFHATIAQEPKQQKESNAVRSENQSGLDVVVDATNLPHLPSSSAEMSGKVEGTTKVRDDINEESDGESTASLDIPVHQPKTVVKEPKAIQSIPIQVPAIAKGIYQCSERTSSSPTDPKSTQPAKILKRPERSVIPVNETPIIETARSVSAPFLKSARVESKPVIAKKVNVGGGGSVSQRIKQFQQLAASKQPTPSFVVPPRTPTSRSNSPAPDFLGGRPSSIISVNSITSINRSPPSSARPDSNPRSEPASATLVTSNLPLKTALSYTPPVNTIPTPPTPPKETTPALSKLEVVKRVDKPQLQVTTKIIRDDARLTPSPTPSPQTSSRPSPMSSPTLGYSDASVMRQKTPNISSAVIELVGVRKHSSDSITDSSRGSNNHEKDRTERPRLFSRSSKEKELEPVPETTLALVDESRAQRDSSSSPKNPSFLQRVSSTLTRRKDTSSTTLTPPQPPPPAPVEAVKKTYLHVGSINVQLPDTMLWKRRFMKIDTEGWLFLSLTDDEVCIMVLLCFISPRYLISF